MRQRVAAMLMALAMAALMPLTAFAAGGDGSGGGKGKGNGDGSGGGGNTGLTVVSVQPADGETDVALTPEIMCQFSHNVTQGGLGEQNMTLISLETADGDPVPVMNWVADAQVEPELRSNLYLKPVSELRPGQEYVVKVAPGVEAKNGMVTEEEQSFTFTTLDNGEDVPKPGSFTPISLVLIGIFVACIVSFIIKGRK